MRYKKEVMQLVESIAFDISSGKSKARSHDVLVKPDWLMLSNKTNINEYFYIPDIYLSIIIDTKP